jgi:hypothetical protein
MSWSSELRMLFTAAAYSAADIAFTRDEPTSARMTSAGKKAMHVRKMSSTRAATRTTMIDPRDLGTVRPLHQTADGVPLSHCVALASDVVLIGRIHGS